MKTIKGALIFMLCFLTLFGGCGKTAKETVTNKKIPVEDITEFYYTRESINFNAFFLRYRFYTEDGKLMFSHEKRERPGDYGPTTEADVTLKGAFELTEEEKQSFLAFLKDGKVSEKKDSAETGDSGPWTYIYWKNDKGKYREFDFPSYSARLEFEEFCAGLSQEER